MVKSSRIFTFGFRAMASTVRFERLSQYESLTPNFCAYLVTSISESIRWPDRKLICGSSFQQGSNLFPSSPTINDSHQKKPVGNFSNFTALNSLRARKICTARMHCRRVLFSVLLGYFGRADWTCRWAEVKPNVYCAHSYNYEMSKQNGKEKEQSG